MLNELFQGISDRLGQTWIYKVLLSTVVVMMAALVAPFYELMTRTATEARVEAERRTPFYKRLLLQVVLGALAGVIHMLVVLDGSLTVFMSTAIFSTVCIFGYENLMVLHGLLIKKTIDTAEAIDPKKLPVVAQYTKKDNDTDA